MAKDFNTNIDLNKNSLLDGKIDPQTILPTTNLYEGRVITHKGQVYIYYKGAWLSKSEFSDLAEDLVGRPELYHEEFLFQPTANIDSVRDGLATIKSINGYTVILNQLFLYESTIIHDSIYVYVVSKKKLPLNHRILLTFEYTNLSHSSALVGLSNFGNLYGQYKDSSLVIGNGTFSDIFTSYNSGNQSFFFRFNSSADTFTIDPSSVRFIDLTLMFGVGNEPVSVNVFEKLFPNIPSEYNTGTLLNFNAEAIKSVGFNAFNGEYAQVLGGMQYHLGGNISSLVFKKHLENEGKVIEIPSDNLYTPSTNGYLMATGSNICIHLQHTGYRDRESEAYTENIVNLPIKAYFPDGMNSIGDIHDEIVWNDISGHYTAIKRIGLRQYQTGDEDLTNVLTDKTNTIYELATPIESIIDNYGLIEYEVSDFGTEEILSTKPTTPIVAEIQYGFNAVDVIRNNLFSIKELFKLILTKLSLTGGKMSGAIDMSSNPFLTAGFENVEELPTDNNSVGRQVFYNGKPAYYNGSSWVDAMGNVIN